jgi:hypothetical protein
VYLDAARCSEPADSRSSSLPFARSRYALWTIQRRFRTLGSGFSDRTQQQRRLLKPTADDVSACLRLEWLQP